MPRKKKKQKRHPLLHEFIPKVLMYSFIAIAVVQAVSSVYLSMSPEYINAAQEVELNVPIGGEASIKVGQDIGTGAIGKYIKTIYEYAIGVVGIIAAVVLMWGGVIWLTAGGNASRVGEAKAWIGAALTGLVLALGSYMILYQVNPDLVAFKTQKIPTVGRQEKKETVTVERTGCEWSAVPVEGKEIAVSDDCSDLDRPEFDPDPMAGTSFNDVYKCYCNKLNWQDWIYDPGIKEQTVDAHNSLIDLLKCMRKEIKDTTVGRISSISDSAGFERCRTDWKRPPCAHMKESCHYGGQLQQNGSLAVDFGDEQNKKKIEKAAEKCGEVYVLDEGNHIHIQLTECTWKGEKDGDY